MRCRPSSAFRIDSLGDPLRIELCDVVMAAEEITGACAVGVRAVTDRLTFVERSYSKFPFFVADPPACARAAVKTGADDLVLFASRR